MGLSDEIYYGTGLPITDERVVDMRDVIYRLDPARNPFVVFANMFPKVTMFDIQHKWLEREGFARRVFKAKWIFETIAAEVAIGVYFDAKNWNAVAMSLAGEMADYDTAVEVAEENMVRIRVELIQAGETGTNYEVTGYLKRSAYENGHKARKMVSSGTEGANTYFNAIQLVEDGTTEVLLQGSSSEVFVDIGETNWAAIATVVAAGGVTGNECYVTVEYPNMQVKGYKQGSGLGTESYKITRMLYNYPQIFKTPISVTGTLQASRLIGGDELTKKRFESGQSHMSDIEYALLFQGGGAEGTDWGITVTGPNPKTVLKGLGVGHAAGKEGFIISNNGNPSAQDPTPMQVTTLVEADYIDMMERLYDDMNNGTQNKVMFTSLRFIKDLSLMALKSDSAFALNLNAPYAEAIGINVRRFVTPFGTLDMVHHPMFSGRYDRYGLILDMKNVALCPYNNRDTRLFMDVGSGEIDGYVDEYRTELSLEIRHEHTHGIAYLKAA